MRNVDEILKRTELLVGDIGDPLEKRLTAKEWAQQQKTDRQRREERERLDRDPYRDHFGGNL